RTITWTATDDCGNDVSASRTFTTQDNIAPTLIGVPANASQQCGTPVPNAVVSAVDNCDTEPNVALSATTVDNTCGYALIRTWTATDDCGNTTSASQTTLFIDTTAPTLSGVPSNATVECSEIPGAVDVIATDNCDSQLDVIFDEFETVLNSCSYQIIRTWSATDNCGNTVTMSQLLTVHDTTNPSVITAPLDDITISCDAQAITEVPTFNDYCDEELNIEFISGISNENNCSFDIERTWIATDNCGNATTFTQIAHVTDTTNPTLNNVPADATVDCGDVPVPAVVTATDNCDTSPTVQLSEQEVANECGWTITRIWNAVDDCGNMASATQTITVIDTSNPQIVSEPADATYECNDIIPDIQPVFIDECDIELTVVAASDNEFAGCSYIIHKSWTATDNCGNSAVAYQDITLADNTPPVLMGIAENATVQCSAIPTLPLVVAQDNCDGDVEVVFTETQTTGCPYTITRVWVATDDCGNEASQTQILTIIDTQAPVILGVPLNANVECGQPIPAAVVQALDNCSEELNLSLDVSTVDNECGAVMTRTWSATDDCGNTTTQIQVINIMDTTAPQLLGVPVNTSTNCNNIPPVVMVVAVDNCTSDINVEFSEVIGQGCPYIITRTWTALDACGNEASQSQVIVVMDEVLPTFVSLPENMIMNCGGSMPPSATVEATDNCDTNVEVTMTDVVLTAECGAAIERTYTATDNCGNEISHTQIISIVDEIAPQIFNIPADITIECSDEMPDYAASVTATDNCDNAPAISVNDVLVNHECWYQINRFYIATDNCGNQATGVQTIYVMDETPPVFIYVPGDVTVSCSDLSAPAELMATDNCDNTIDYQFSEVAMSDGCPYLIKRIWTASDDCGNTATVVQVVTVVDDEAPVFEEFELFTEISCDEIVAYSLAAQDNCDPQVQVTIVDEMILEGDCLGTIQRTYEAVDNCGNTATAMQVIAIVDYTAPVLHNVPAETTVNCEDAPSAMPQNIYATDNCSENLTVSFNETQIGQFCPYDLERTWSVTDLCGNTTTATQTIHVVVDVPPVVFLTAYPNPAPYGQTRIQFSLPKDEQVSIVLFDAIGKQLMTMMDGTAHGGTLYDWTLATKDIGAGTYTLRVLVGGEMYTERFTLLGK
ncbi:MAG: T9SS type A sorting domain-containing protein, partial [Flavobacteriales bacterium]